MSAYQIDKSLFASVSSEKEESYLSCTGLSPHHPRNDITAEAAATTRMRRHTGCGHDEEGSDAHLKLHGEPRRPALD
jgi:hypothetical protein